MNVLNELLMRTGPFNDVITLEELRDIRAVNLRWQKDSGADRYIVMRSIDKEHGFDEFLPIYNGLEQTYIDRDIEVAVTYAYRLDKLRGNKIIPGDGYVYYSRSLPFRGVIRAQSINDGRSVYLTWEKDANADKYIVMKTEAGISGINFGNEYATQKIEIVEILSYIDNDIDAEKNYAYRLDKVCGGVVFEGLAITFFEKSRPDPFPGIITAQNLNNGKSAYLTWESDKGADDYRIMRAINDGNALIFTERQDMTDGFFLQGPTSAIDSILQDDKGYFYRLDKKRNNVWIPGLEITIFSRTRPMPIGDTPVVTSFRADRNILITWQHDEGADTYILMRAFDNPATSRLDDYVKMYEGTELQYLDTAVNVLQNERYVYKLYKERNGTIYRWDDRIALGVAVVTEEDRHEPNNTEAQATLLETYRLANIYCFGFSIDNTVLEDIDWYKVSIPPGKVANIAVQYDNMGNDEYFLLYVPHMEQRSIIHNVTFQIRNDDTMQKYVTFAIMPDRSKFLSGSGVGGSVVGYTITWHSIENN